MALFPINFYLCVENILLHDFAHLGWCDTCVERSAKTDSDCFIVSIFAEHVQSLEQSFVEIFADLYLGYNTRDVIVRKIAVPRSSHACHGKSSGGKWWDI